jgi:transcriptional regulator with XRE-family HTH domain
MGGPELKKLIEQAGLSQREVAKMISIDERTMRRYIAGDLPIPRVVELAVTCLVEHSPQDNQ